MTTIEIARRMARLGAESDALRAYELALSGGAAPEERLEAAAYTLEHGGAYQLA